MTRWPRWVLWSAAAVIVWAGWVTFLYLPHLTRATREAAELAEATQKQHAIVMQIQSTPAAMARLDSLRQQLALAAPAFPNSQRLNEYVQYLTTLADSAGVRPAFVAPDLVNMLALAAPIDAARSDDFRLDTLVIELGGAGRFGEVGKWLDRVESEPAFRWWRLCQWDKGKEPGIVTFRGFASFLVVVPAGETS